LSEGGLVNAVSFSADCYRLSGESIRTDISEFYRIIKENKTVDENSITALQKAVAIYKSGYFHKDGYLWAEEKREEIRHQFLALLKKLSNYFKEKKDWECVEKYFIRIIEEDPYSEDNFLELLKLKISLGQRAKAKQLYSAFYKRLKRDMGLEPCPDIKRLYKSIYA
jgi:two-component SAPR family response regulator